jgi:hypothetical protein
MGEKSKKPVKRSSVRVVKKPTKAKPRPLGTIQQKPEDEQSRTKDLSSTMQMSASDLFEDLPSERETHLDITCPGREPRRIKLGDETLIIGRDDDCDIPLPLKNVSRNHAQVTYNGDEYSIRDLESTNGIFVNNIRVSKCILRTHDLIRVGEAKLLFVREKVRG